VIIRVERTGGFAGMSKRSEINTDNLPPSLETTVKKMMTSTKIPPLVLKSTPIGAADHYIYKISIKDGANENILEFNQYNIQDDFKSLIKYVERNSKKI
jgi:hypothetical protein